MILRPEREAHGRNSVQVLQGRYRLGQRLGFGGMGEVFKAEDLQTGAPVAIKRIISGHAMDPGRRMRFVQEARAAGMLQHCNIVQILDIGQVEGNLYIVMEYIPGTSLSNRISQLMQDVPSVVPIFIDVAEALGFAHTQGIIHGDIKPENIMVLPNGRAKVLDFGLARETALPNTLEGGGTILYMPPEQFQGQPLDGRSDIWSLGVTLFVTLAGRFPFDTPGEIVSASVPSMPEGLPFSAELSEVFARILAKDPKARYQTAEQVSGSLKTILETNERANCSARLHSAPESRNDYVVRDSVKPSRKAQGYAPPDLGFTHAPNGELIIISNDAFASTKLLKKVGALLGRAEHGSSLAARIARPAAGLAIVAVWVGLCVIKYLLLKPSTDSNLRIDLAVVSVVLLLSVMSLGPLASAIGFLLNAANQLPRCVTCGLWMKRTAQWIRFASNKNEMLFGPSDCMAALKYGLWQEAAKLLVIHEAEVVSEYGHNFITPARFHLAFFECGLCHDHAARLTMDYRTANRWKQAGIYHQAYWGGRTGKPSAVSRLRALPETCVRTLAEATSKVMPKRSGAGLPTRSLIAICAILMFWGLYTLWCFWVEKVRTH